MAKISTSDIAAYKRRLVEYAIIYNKMSLGIQNGYKTYAKLVKEVADSAAYLRMLEDMYPDLKQHKPKHYTAHYRSVNIDK